MSEANSWCFACGKANPIGLKLEFLEKDNTYITVFTARQEHQGYDNIMHGGLVGTLLDEVMARYICDKGINAVTARLEVRYRKPTPIGVELTISSRLIKSRGRTYQLAGEIRLPDGTITAEGSATVMATE